MQSIQPPFEVDTDFVPYFIHEEYENKEAQ